MRIGEARRGFISAICAAFSAMWGCAPEPGAPPPLGADAGSPAADASPPDAAPDPGVGVGLTAIELALEPASPWTVSTTGTISATGVLSSGARIDLRASASWHTTSSTTVEVFAGGRAVAVGPGIARLWATRGRVESARLTVEVLAPDEGELRGVWVTRWSYRSSADLQQIIDDVERARLNAIFFQVRGVADAYYQSSIEPWASRLSGTLGQDPGWDPLGELIALVRPRGIAVHAWLNTFPAWSGSSAPSESTPRHVLLSQPEWLCADERGQPMPLGGEGYQFLSPGNAEVRAHVARVALDLAARYSIDGLHFDFIRYPGPSYCHDAASQAAYAEAQRSDPTIARGDFQREQITRFIADVRARAPSAVAVTVANWGIYKNRFGWSGVSRGFDDYFQDAHRWVREGHVDALCPMTYWRLTTPKGGRTDFATLAEDHVAAARGGGRMAFLGISAEHDGAELIEQVRVARAAGARGVVFFDLAQLRSNSHLDRLAQGPFSERAAPPRLR